MTYDWYTDPRGFPSQAKQQAMSRAELDDLENATDLVALRGEYEETMRQFFEGRRAELARAERLKTNWSVQDVKRGRLEELLADGWEPFAVSLDSQGIRRYHVRKQGVDAEGQAL